MSGRINIADPSHEPTDEELGQLMREAFADVRARRLAANVELRRQIAERRQAVRAAWAERMQHARERP